MPRRNVNCPFRSAAQQDSDESIVIAGGVADARFKPHKVLLLPVVI